MYKFGDSVITHDNNIGIVTQVLPDNEYFVSFKTYGMIYRECDLKEWHGEIIMNKKELFTVFICLIIYSFIFFYMVELITKKSIDLLII